MLGTKIPHCYEKESHSNLSASKRKQVLGSSFLPVGCLDANPALDVPYALLIEIKRNQRTLPGNGHKTRSRTTKARVFELSDVERAARKNSVGYEHKLEQRRVRLLSPGMVPKEIHNIVDDPVGVA
ncbi:transcription-repair-coupling factor [Striga asiatica]|uniref:Transcription-repair-coupling factor n=1 Tax=Striga asiatica TaxID=4170 RepID=A0A5A7R2T6_STRAF|nr:transcription-repair-coupling factor [Striga asiatica]